ncbi:MAG: hypothetical protein ACFCUT_08350 [Kiloniellaceae bacterium]
MPATKRPPTDHAGHPQREPAALAALSICESLILALVESGILDPQAARRCLLDAAAAYDRPLRDGEETSVESQAASLIDGLLHQIEAMAPSDATRPEIAARPTSKS